ncbi:MAG: PspA/IM30 family protein [Acidimicrobiales bacterium]
MFKALRRMWKYMAAKISGDFEARADPKVQLQQAIVEAQEQHRRLKEQAANLIAMQKQGELRLNRDMEQLERLNGNARQAVLMADDATKKGEAPKAEEYTRAAEAIANQLIAVEAQIEQQKTDLLNATGAADQAKAAVQQNSSALQKKLTERNQLMGQLEQAKMQEQMNKAMASLSETVGEDVPTLDEVRNKIEARYAKAKGMQELTGSTVESRMLEIEQAARGSEAQGRLAEIRAQLGLAPAATDVPAVTAEPAAAPAPTPQEGSAQ